MSARRWLVAGGIAAVGVAAAATAMGGGFDGLVADAPSPTPLATNVPSPTATPLPQTPEASAVATQPPASPTPKPISTERPKTPAPTVHTYVVEEGDTLSTIATRFGTSVTALQQANGLGKSDVINIGQVLVIP